MVAESAVQTQQRLEAARMGLLLYRNNVGACEDKTGRLIRYGLANDSAEQNRHIKSSDLIGMTTVVVTSDMIGRRVAVFTAAECKRSDWQFSQADERACAQLRFHEIVRAAGGFAGFVQKPGDLLANVLRW